MLVHDVKNRAVAHMLVEMTFGPFPMALGVLYDDPAPSFEQAVIAQECQPGRRQDRRPPEARLQGRDLDGVCTRAADAAEAAAPGSGPEL